MSFTWPVREHNRGMSAPTLAREDVDFLSLLSEVNRRRLLEGSTRAVFPAGSIAVHPEGPLASFLLERGLARAYSSVPDGRHAPPTFFHSLHFTRALPLLSHPPLTSVPS